MILRIISRKDRRCALNQHKMIERGNRHLRQVDRSERKSDAEKYDRRICLDQISEEGEIQNKRVVTEWHHRRPRSLGGSNDVSNLSYVRPKPHRHWHTLFGNLNAMQICEMLNASPQKPEGIELYCRFINGSQVEKEGGVNHSEDLQKRETAWNYLFAGLSFTKIIDYINNVWLDPAYHFYITR